MNTQEFVNISAFFKGIILGQFLFFCLVNRFQQILLHLDRVHNMNIENRRNFQFDYKFFFANNVFCGVSFITVSFSFIFFIITTKNCQELHAFIFCIISRTATGNCLAAGSQLISSFFPVSLRKIKNQQKRENLGIIVKQKTTGGIQFISECITCLKSKFFLQIAMVHYCYFFNTVFCFLAFYG